MRVHECSKGAKGTRLGDRDCTACGTAMRLIGRAWQWAWQSSGGLETGAATRAALQDEVGDVRFTAGRRNGFGVQQVAWALLTACAALDVLAAQGQKTTPPDRRQVTRATSGAKA